MANGKGHLLVGGDGSMACVSCAWLYPLFSARSGRMATAGASRVPVLRPSSGHVQSRGKNDSRSNAPDPQDGMEQAMGPGRSHLHVETPGKEASCKDASWPGPQTRYFGSLARQGTLHGAERDTFRLPRLPRRPSRSCAPRRLGETVPRRRAWPRRWPGPKLAAACEERDRGLTPSSLRCLIARSGRDAGRRSVESSPQPSEPLERGIVLIPRPLAEC